MVLWSLVKVVLNRLRLNMSHVGFSSSLFRIWSGPLNRISERMTSSSGSSDTQNTMIISCLETLSKCEWHTF